MHRKVNLEGECVGELGIRISRMRRAYFHPPIITCEKGMCQMAWMDQLNVGASFLSYVERQGKLSCSAALLMW